MGNTYFVGSENSLSALPCWTCKYFKTESYDKRIWGYKCGNSKVNWPPLIAIHVHEKDEIKNKQVFNGCPYKEYL